MSKKLFGLMADDGATMLGTAEELAKEILKREGLNLAFSTDCDSQETDYIVFSGDPDDFGEEDVLFRKPWKQGNSNFSRAYADYFWHIRNGKYCDDDDDILVIGDYFFFDIDNGKQVLAFLPYDSVLDSVSAREVKENELDTGDEFSVRWYVYERACTSTTAA